MFKLLIWKKFYNPQASNELLLPAVCSFTPKLLPLTHTHVRAFNLRNVNEEVIFIFSFFIYYLYYIYRFGAILQAVYYQ